MIRLHQYNSGYHGSQNIIISCINGNDYIICSVNTIIGSVHDYDYDSIVETGFNNIECDENTISSIDTITVPVSFIVRNDDDDTISCVDTITVPIFFIVRNNSVPRCDAVYDEDNTIMVTTLSTSSLAVRPVCYDGNNDIIDYCNTSIVDTNRSNVAVIVNCINCDNNKIRSVDTIIKICPVDTIRMVV